jgi:penicillin-binding protein 2
MMDRDALTLRNPEQELRQFTGRVLTLWVVLALAILLLVLRVFQLQVLEHDRHAARSEKNRIEVQPLAPPRGEIYDRKGRLIAGNLPVFSLMVVKERVEDLEATLTLLDALIGLTAEEREAFHGRLAQRRRPLEPVTLRLRLDPEAMARVAVNRHRLPGVEIDAGLLRHYPEGALLTHAVGSVRRLSEADLQRVDPTAYSATRFIGRLGVEAHYERALHGAVGHERVETDARGRITRTLDRTPPRAGHNLTLHLDRDLQAAAVAALKGRRGAVVALDPRSGGILALASTPSYNPNDFIWGLDAEGYQALQRDRDQPLFNRPARGQYAPGSTFKPLVALAAVTEGVTDWERSLQDPGYYQLPGQSRKYRDWSWTARNGGGQGEVDLRKAIYRSSNTYFFDLGARLGPEPMASVARAFGLGSDRSVDVYGARSGLVPDGGWKQQAQGQPWYPGDSLNYAIGQGALLVTPLQLATVAATLANRGRPVRPRFLMASDVRLPELAPAPLAPIDQFSPADYARVIDAMEAVVHRGNQRFGENGTAWAYIGQDIPYRMAGKSGTAQVVEIPQGEEYDEDALEERQRKHAWFMAFAPVEAPEIAVAVLVENGGGGSQIAAPVARAVVDAWLVPPAAQVAQQ